MNAVGEGQPEAQDGDADKHTNGSSLGDASDLHEVAIAMEASSNSGWWDGEEIPAWGPDNQAAPALPADSGSQLASADLEHHLSLLQVRIDWHCSIPHAP